MDKITSKDIKALREYSDKLNAITLEKPPDDILTEEEWEEAMTEIKRTGKIPEKYIGRIAESKITTHSDIIDGKYTYFPEGITQTTYFDVAMENHMEKYRRLEREYHDLIIKALNAYYFRRSDNNNQGQDIGIIEIITALLEDPAIRRELEKEAAAGQLSTLAPLGSVPNGDSLNWLFRVISANKGGRIVQANPANRHEEVKAEQYGDKVRFTRTNKQANTTVTVEIDQADKYLSKTNKTFTKVLLFTLQKMTAQNFPLEVGFSLQELVELGMYSNTSNALRAVKDFFAQQKLTTLSGTVKKGRKTVTEEGGVLFYHYHLENGRGFVKLSVNDKFNMEFIANYFTVFPRFAYRLSNNAFSLVRYIFFIARQNTQSIKDKGTFTISLEAVRENLGLPAPEDVNNRKYRQYIIEPIEEAIEEIEEALLKVPEAKEYGFTLTPYGTDTSNINKWLQGYLEIGLNGDFAETFVRIATKAEKDRAQWEKVKAAELARIAARTEAKEAQDAPKRTRKKRKKE